MKSIPFANTQSIGTYAGGAATFAIPLTNRRKISLRGFGVLCSAMSAVTGPIVVTIAGLIDGSQPGVGPGILSFTFDPSTAGAWSFKVDLPKGCVESQGPMTFTVSPNGDDTFSGSLQIEYWGKLVPIK